MKGCCLASDADGRSQMQAPVSGTLEPLSAGDEGDYDIRGVLVEVLAATLWGSRISELLE